MRKSVPPATLLSQRAFRLARRNFDASPTNCGCGVLAGSSGFRAILRSSIKLLPFCMLDGRDQSVPQPSAPAYSAHGCEYSPLMLRKL
ncbi:hypothetical protein D3C72_1234870 [compost metagenome]